MDPNPVRQTIFKIHLVLLFYEIRIRIRLFLTVRSGSGFSQESGPDPGQHHQPDPQPWQYARQGNIGAHLYTNMSRLHFEIETRHIM